MCFTCELHLSLGQLTLSSRLLWACIRLLPELHHFHRQPSLRGNSSTRSCSPTKEIAKDLGSFAEHLHSGQLIVVSLAIGKMQLLSLRTYAYVGMVGNNSTDLDYINSLLSKWMPSSSPRVAVDSRPRLSGIMDTINSTLAHGVQTRLPSAFYDPKAQEIIDRIVVEEWFSGYKESAEYRKLGIGALLGDAVSRMVGSAEKGSSDGRLEVQGVEGDLGKGRDSETSIKLALNGCHDTTVAAILCSLGAFEGEKWPPYTSHVALELFRDSSVPLPPETPALRKSPKQPLFGSSSKTTETSHSMARKPLSEMNQDEKERLKCYYVRVRYNDRPIVVPGCRLLGKHWEGDESFCTLVSI